MSSAGKVCGCPVQVVVNWIKIPDVDQHCVQEVAKFTVVEFNKKYSNSLKFHSIYEGWYAELGPNELKYRLHVKAEDCLGRLLNFEAIVLEEKPLTERIRNLVIFILIPTPGHCVGNVEPPKEEKWIKIPKPDAPCVQDVAKFAVEEFNKTNKDSLKYHSTIEGWYQEVGQDNVRFRLRLKPIDCLERVRIVEAIVHVKEFFIKKFKTLESFKLITTVEPPKEEKWIKIPNPQAQCVQDVAKFALEEFNKTKGDSLKYDSTYEGWYAELGKDDVKIRLHLKVIDCLGRVRKIEALVLVKEFFLKKIKTLEIVTLIPELPKEGKWIKILNLHAPCVQEVAKFAVEEYNKKDSLKYDSTYEGSYVEVCRDDVKFCLCMKGKDCLGRVRNYEALVRVKEFFTKKIKTLESFKLIENKC